MHCATMDQRIPFKELGEVLATLEYPTDRSTAIQEVGDTTIQLADGRVNLGDLLQRTDAEYYDRPGDLQAAIHATLPRRAVGEPYQSEGDA